MTANYGWFAVARADVALILDHAGEKTGPSLIAVWAAALNIANAHRSLELDLPVNQIARAAGLSYKPTLNALHALCQIGLLGIEERFALGKKNREPSRYTIKASVAPYVETTEGLCQNDIGVMSSTRDLMTENNTNNRTIRLTPEVFQEQAKSVNNGRLPESELQRFCQYWLEKSARGKCRFQAERFFDLSRRIATWLSKSQKSAGTANTASVTASGFKRRAD